MNQTDANATERAAFHAGATIQAYTVEGDDGSTPLSEVEGRGYWRDLSCDGEPKFSCHPTRYRVKDHHPAEAPVAWQITDVTGYLAFTTDADPAQMRREMGIFTVTPLYLRPDPEVTALRAEVERLDSALSSAMNQLAEADTVLARVEALPDKWEATTAHRCDDSVCHANGAVLTCASELRAALGGK